jgi:hypothetical protein
VRKLYLLPVLVALIMSVISSYFLFVGSGLNLIPWGLLALSFGLIGHSKQEAGWLGAIYGFGQAFIFLWIDKKGSLTLGKFLILFVVISALGILAALCAALAARLSFAAKRNFQK